MNLPDKILFASNAYFPSGAVKVNNGEAQRDYLEAVSQVRLLLVPLAAPLLAFAGYLVHLCLRSVALLAHGCHLLSPSGCGLLGCVVSVSDALQAGERA